MQHEGGLELGMFLGGLLMALVPISVSVGFLLWSLKERQRAQRRRAAVSQSESREPENAP
jgi:hypothetical protein